MDTSGDLSLRIDESPGEGDDGSDVDQPEAEPFEIDDQLIRVIITVTLFELGAVCVYYFLAKKNVT